MDLFIEPSTKNKREMILLKNAFIITMDPSRSKFIEKGTIVIDNDCIMSIYTDDDEVQQQQPPQESFVEVIDCEGKYVIPGLINTHVHCVQQLGRGLGDDVDLITWLHDRIWPYESHMNDRDVYISTKLMILEQIRSGVTCWADAGGHHMEQIVKAVDEMGVRAVLSESTMDQGDGLPDSWVKSTDECIQSQVNNFNKYHGSCDGRIRYWFNLRTIFNCSDELVQRTKKKADELEVGIHMHVAEIKAEVEFCQQNRGSTTVTHLENLGVLDKNLLAVHSVWLSEEELQLYKKRDVKVSHCPAAAMRYLGFAKIPEMLDLNICMYYLLSNRVATNTCFRCINWH
jgi:5-methylthioadenosine/S-adenosylhomocysteine deaminase